MQNIKYHAITIAAAILFSYVAAITINGIIKNSLTVYPSEKNLSRKSKNIQKGDANVDIDQIVQSGFFVIAPSTSIIESTSANSSADELKLIGTITGNQSIARALILKRGKPQPEVFKLWKDVYGFQLTQIDPTKIFLKRENKTYTLNLYEKKEFTNAPMQSNNAETAEGVIRRNISRAEMQQKVLNNLDTAMRGISGAVSKDADGQPDGYKLVRVRPSNILYEYGMRSGDVVKRINGKKTDSAEKMLNMWQGMKDESKINVDVERDGKVVTFELNILD
ncbi:MAG: PDZ domain-containing protein [Leptospirales bacterium]|nr:PDZ domain-containing protein [Leptospirales bacterium]